MRPLRLGLVLFLAGGVVFGYGSALGSLFHGGHSWGRHCRDAEVPAASAARDHGHGGADDADQDRRDAPP